MRILGTRLLHLYLFPGFELILLMVVPFEFFLLQVLVIDSFMKVGIVTLHKNI